MSEASDETKVVLIVDPDGVESGALGRSLKQIGCEPQTCLDMHAALIAARAERPALVIASTELLDGDGFALCDQLRTEPTLEGVPVVLLCSTPAAARAHEASPKRANAYLFRPLSVAAIVGRVAEFLDDDELTLNSAVEIVHPGATRRPPPPPTKRPASRPASVAPPALPPPPRVPRALGSPPATASVRAPLPLPSRPPAPRDALDLREQLNARDHEIKRLRDELHAVEAKHAAALARQREELERRFRAEKEAELEVLERNISHARDSLIAAMRGVDLARDRSHASAPISGARPGS